MEWYIILGVIITGFVAGFINTLAGSGSLLTLPLLMFLGLPANVANGTNRVAILFQNIIGVTVFKQQKIFTFSESIYFAIPAILGSILGAFIAVEIDEIIMKNVITCLLIVMFFVIILKPNAWIKGTSKKIKTKVSFWQIIIFFFIGIYGGFIQAGVGLLILSGLVLGAGFDLVKANAIKSFIVLLYTIFALIIFIYNGQVNYMIGILLSVGNMTGALIASKFAVKKGAVYVRYILLVVIVGAILKLILY